MLCRYIPFWALGLGDDGTAGALVFRRTKLAGKLILLKLRTINGETSVPVRCDANSSATSLPCRVSTFRRVAACSSGVTLLFLVGRTCYCTCLRRQRNSTLYYLLVLCPYIFLLFRSFLYRVRVACLAPIVSLKNHNTLFVAYSTLCLAECLLETPRDGQVRTPHVLVNSKHRSTVVTLKLATFKTFCFVTRSSSLSHIVTLFRIFLFFSSLVTTGTTARLGIPANCLPDLACLIGNDWIQPEERVHR